MSKREICQACGVIAVFLIISYLLQTRWCGTPLRSDEREWQAIIDYHLTAHPFNSRVLTTQVILGLHERTGLSLRDSYVFLQFGLMAVFGFVFYRYLRKIGCEPVRGKVGVAAMMSSLPIIFAFSEPIHTWDDIWVYIFLTLSIQALVTSRGFAAAIWFTLACFAREQSLLYYPILVYGLWRTGAGTSVKVIAALLPLSLFGPYLAYAWRPSVVNGIILFDDNFASLIRTRDTVYSLFMAYGWLWPAWGLAVFGKPTSEPDTFPRRFLERSSLYAVGATLLLALGFAMARETRLMFPPVVFVVPLVLLWLRERWKWYVSIFSDRWYIFFLYAAGAVAAGIMTGRLLFPSFEYRNCPDFSRLWAGVQIGLSLVLIGLFSLVRLSRRSDGKPIV